jgi:colicin import membrane protein
MPVTKKAAPRGRRPKEEVQLEFARIEKENAEARESADPKAAETSRLRESEVRQAVEGTSVESVVQQISTLTLDVSKALGGLSEKLIAEVNLLASTREAVALERAELERLHKIDIAATSVDLLVQEHERKKQEMESEIEARRAAWTEETARVERERREQEENLKKQRQRDIDEYEYKKNLERKRAQDKYEEEQKLLERKNKEKQENLEKSWTDREAALKASEEELVRLRKQVEEFPSRLEKECAAAAAQAGKAAEQRLEQQIFLLKRDAEAEKRLFDLQEKGMQDQLNRQAAQITALESQVSAAKQQVQDIAVKAIEGASGAKALAHIEQIAMEQAKKTRGE